MSEASKRSSDVNLLLGVVLLLAGLVCLAIGIWGP